MVKLRVCRSVHQGECFHPAICFFFEGADTVSTFSASVPKLLCPHGTTEYRPLALNVHVHL